MTSKRSQDIAAFQRELIALVRKYDVDIQHKCGPYREHEGVEIYVGPKVAATLSEYGEWFIGNQVLTPNELEK